MRSTALSLFPTGAVSATDDGSSGEAASALSRTARQAAVFEVHSTVSLFPTGAARAGADGSSGEAASALSRTSRQAAVCASAEQGRKMLIEGRKKKGWELGAPTLKLCDAPQGGLQSVD